MCHASKPDLLGLIYGNFTDSCLKSFSINCNHKSIISPDTNHPLFNERPCVFIGVYKTKFKLDTEFTRIPSNKIDLKHNVYTEVNDGTKEWKMLPYNSSFKELLNLHFK